MKTLSELSVLVQGFIATLFSNAMLIVGIAPGGVPAAIQTDAAGNVIATDPGYAAAGSIGVTGAVFTSADQSGGAAAVTDAPVSGQKLVITDLRFSSDTALRLDFIDSGNTNVLFSEYLPANGGGQISLRGKLKLSTADGVLEVQTSAAGNIAVTALYYSEA